MYEKAPVRNPAITTDCATVFMISILTTTLDKQGINSINTCYVHVYATFLFAKFIKSDNKITKIGQKCAEIVISLSDFDIYHNAWH